MLLFFKSAPSGQRKKAEKVFKKVFYAQTGENLPEYAALAVFQGHNHCFPARTGISTLGEEDSD